MKRAVWAFLAGLVLLVLVIVVGSLRQSGGDPGNLTETLYPITEQVPVPTFVEVTQDMGLAEWENTSQSHLSGGVALGDLNGDGLLDLTLAGGNIGIFLNTGTSFVPVQNVPPDLIGVALSTAMADIDGDGHTDIMFGPAAGDVLVVWGGSWATNNDFAQAETLALPGGEFSTGFATGDLNADGRLDIVRIAYGRSQPADDVIFRQTGFRSFEAVALPNGGGKSLAVEIVDVDGDGSLEIWVTRDVGWTAGADSLYRRSPSGNWTDVATEVGVAMEIDGMGVTVADLTGNGYLDGYLSDIGENDFLEGSNDGFAPVSDSGASRIRPPSAPDDVVSSSWASAATDVNLDGIVDLVVVNGGFPFFAVPNKIPDTGIALDDPPAVFLGLGDGTFTDTWPVLGLSWEGPGRGLAVGDIDNDGDVDLIVTRLEGTAVVYRNETPGSSLSVVPGSDCVGNGATVWVDTDSGTTMQVLASHSFLGSHAPGVIVGAPSPGGEVRVRWPGGEVTTTPIPDGGTRAVASMPCP